MTKMQNVTLTLEEEEEDLFAKWITYLFSRLWQVVYVHVHASVGSYRIMHRQKHEKTCNLDRRWLWYSI